MSINHLGPLGLAAIAALVTSVLWLIRRWREQQYDLRGKTILITGGSRGLGLVMARQLVAAGGSTGNLCAG